MFQFECPNSHRLEDDESHAGHTVNCPICKVLFIIPAPVASESYSSQPLTNSSAGNTHSQTCSSGPGQTIHTCSNCRIEIDFSDIQSGQYQCPNCGRIISWVAPIKRKVATRQDRNEITDIAVINSNGKFSIRKDGRTFPAIGRAELLWLQHLVREASNTTKDFEKTVFEIKVRRSPPRPLVVCIGRESEIMSPEECIKLLHEIQRAHEAGGTASSNGTQIQTGAFNEAIASAVKAMALLGNDHQRRELKSTAATYDLPQWRFESVTAVTGVGVLTGLAPGPAGIVLEGLDIAYLLASCGRACYGIGHILGREVDYDRDIPLILAIWANAGEAAAIAGAGKVGVKIGGKAAVVLGTQAASKLGGKMLAKVSGKAAAKLTGKLGAKAAAGFMPIVGPAVSGGINYWVATSLMDAAEKYYRSGYVILEGNAEDWMGESVEDGVEVAQALWSDVDA